MVSRKQPEVITVSKSAELIVHPPRASLQTSPLLPPPQPEIPHVSRLTLLGVELDEHLCFKDHISKAVSKACHTLYALKTLKHHGLPQPSLPKSVNLLSCLG